MKSFLKTYKEYSKEYEEFDLKKLKSIYIEKDLMESESQETLLKNGDNGDKYEWFLME